MERTTTRGISQGLVFAFRGMFSHFVVCFRISWYVFAQGVCIYMQTNQLDGVNLSPKYSNIPNLPNKEGNKGIRVGFHSFIDSLKHTLKDKPKSKPFSYGINTKHPLMIIRLIACSVSLKMITRLLIASLSLRRKLLGGGIILMP